MTPAAFATLHRAVKAYVLIFVLWGLYRLVFRLPEEVEETFLKPIVFLGAVLLMERPKRIDQFFLDIWGHGPWLPALWSGLGFGALATLFFGISSILALGRLEFGSEITSVTWFGVVGISLATAVWEEWTFSGYMLGAFTNIITNAWYARLAAASLFALVHLPILLFWYKFTLPITLFQLVLLLVLGVANSILMGRTRNLLAPILSHTIWGIAVLLFR